VVAFTETVPDLRYVLRIRLRERSLIPVNWRISESRIPWSDIESAISLASSEMRRPMREGGAKGAGKRKVGKHET
jgi:hypothetical protein